MWRMSGRDPGKSPVVTKWAVRAWSLRKEKIEEGDGGRGDGGGERAQGDLSVKWWSEKPWLVESTRSPSLPVVVPGPGSSLICLRTRKEGGGVWRRVIPEGFVTLCGGDTSEDLLASTVDRQCLPQSFPWGRRGGGGLHGFSQSHQSPCMSRSRSPFSTVLSLTSTGLSSERTGASQDPLCSGPAAWSGLSSVLVVKSFHTTQQFHSPSMSQPNKGGVSVADCASGIKEWKTFLSLNISSPVSSVLTSRRTSPFVPCCSLHSNSTRYVLLSSCSPSYTLYWFVSAQQMCLLNLFTH